MPNWMLESEVARQVGAHRQVTPAIADSIFQLK
jgi:hypothetical protein